MSPGPEPLHNVRFHVITPIHSLDESTMKPSPGSLFHGDQCRQTDDSHSRTATDRPEIPFSAIGINDTLEAHAKVGGEE